VPFFDRAVRCRITSRHLDVNQLIPIQFYLINGCKTFGISVLPDFTEKDAEHHPAAHLIHHGPQSAGRPIGAGIG
jgi:hypothetical protein